MRNLLKKVAVVAAIAVGFALTTVASEASVQVGVVAQRFPWNGMVDVTFRVAGAPEAGVKVVVSAQVKGQEANDNKLVVATVTGAKNGEQTVAFNANDFAELKGKQLKDVKVTAAVEK